MRRQRLAAAWLGAEVRGRISDRDRRLRGRIRGRARSRVRVRARGGGRAEGGGCLLEPLAGDEHDHLDRVVRKAEGAPGENPQHAQHHVRGDKHDEGAACQQDHRPRPHALAPVHLGGRRGARHLQLGERQLQLTPTLTLTCS